MNGRDTPIHSGEACSPGWVGYKRVAVDPGLASGDAGQLAQIRAMPQCLLLRVAAHVAKAGNDRYA